jgi:hypothetical protein
MAVPEKAYETWESGSGWNNDTPFGKEYGENLVSWCVIFDWDMYHDVGLDAIVPKTDNVSSFTSWAQDRGQWSEYPSVGAWVNFGNGAHTELVIGFNATTVFTKGGNSIKAGATDAGQGNGVWSHQHARTDDYVTGYFAPKFPDGICPPTADPNDYRGGKARVSYTWAPKPKPTPPPAAPAKPSGPYVPYPGEAWFKAKPNSPIITRMGQRLVAQGCGKYQDGPGPQWTDADRDSYKAWQRKQGYTGKNADGWPGKDSWDALRVPR